MKYRKKPVEVEAFQFDGDLIDKKGCSYVPEWANEAHEEGILFFDSLDGNSPPCELFIKTLEGILHASVGDYIIRGVKGEIYPIKANIFFETYEKVK